MGSLGELFVQLVFEGDTSKANNFINKTKEIIDLTDKQIRKNKLLIQYLKDLREAQSEAQKKLIKSNFAKEIKKLELEEELSKATEKQNTHSEAVKKAYGKFIKLTAAITGTVYAIKRLTDSLINENQEFLNLTRTSDIALSSFQKWNSIGRMLGVPNAEQQIKSLNERIFELKLTGANASGFMLAGIRPTNADDVMEQLRGRVKGLNDTAASYLLRQLGLDPTMLHLLRLTRSEFEALNNDVKQYRLTPEQSKSIQLLNIQLQIANQKLKYLKDRVVLAILPYWVKFVNYVAKAAVAVGKFINENKDLIKILARFCVSFAAVIAAFGTFILTLKAVPVALKAIEVGLLALAKNPAIIGWTALFAGLALILDDIATFFMGGESYTGDIVNFLKTLEDMPFADFVDKLEKVLDHPMPEWLKAMLSFYKDDNGNIDVKKGITTGAMSLLLPGFGISSSVIDLLSRAAQQTINNNNNKNLSFNQTNNISTNQPVANIKNGLENMLTFANYNSQYQTV